jgi:hypothetical protein
MPSIVQDRTTISKMNPMIVVGLLKLRVQRQNLAIGSAPLRANKERDKERQRLASSRHTRGPIDGTLHPQVLYLSLSQEDSFTPLRWASI